MAWSPHGHADAIDALRRLAQIVLIDSQDEPRVESALARAAELAEHAYIVDLAWLRSTPWRERVAAAFDPPAVRASLPAISGVTVRYREDSLAAALLFCGWLSSRLGWKPGALSAGTRRWTRPARAPRHGPGPARARRHEVALRLDEVDQNAPGLAGVTIETAAGESVALDR